MGTDNLSPSYLAEREQVRRWLQNTADGRLAVDQLRRTTSPQEMSRVLDNDRFTDWGAIRKEYDGGVALAWNCEEARKAFEMRRAVGGKWLNFFSPPLQYVLRRQAETTDPNYWNDPINTYREALANPEWCRVPRWYLLGKLEQHMPRGKPVAA